MNRTAVMVGGVVALLAAAHASGDRAQASANAASNPYDLMYLPEGRALRVASLGYRSMLADLVWLRAIQYYGEQRLTTRNYDQAERLFQVIYDLDPYFKGATRFGALVLSQDAKDPDGAIALLDRASTDDPRAWEYPFDEGFIYQTVLRDYEKAGTAYRKAAAMPKAPPLAARLAGSSFARLGDRGTSREIWQEIRAGAENDLTRELAERNLKNLDLDEAEETLTNAVKAFRTSHARLPANWEELVHSGSLAKLPGEPWGGAYFWDPGTEHAYSSTTVDRRMAVARDVFRSRVKTYLQRHGKLPATLDDVVADHLAPAPWRPFGLSLAYDPVTGRVAWNPPWPEIEARTHGDGEAAS
ncbi:MAG: hypothetical protein U0167_04880 [bacterium]